MQPLLHSPESESENVSLDALAKTLDYAVRALHASIGNDSVLARRLVSLNERLRDNRLQLAVLGQFKRGKSTFINALIGAPLLPVAVVPLTAVPVFIAWRESPYVRVSFEKGRSLPEELVERAPDAIRNFLFRFVAEEENPKNRLGVSRVDLFYPTPLLSDGTLLIDTPGVGSTLRHNTEAALEVLPECDAALFVVSADPPITEAELDYLRQVKAKVARVFYVMNKIDYLGTEELARVTGFLREVLEQNGLWTPSSRIFGVSARNGLEAKQRGEQKAFEASGMAALESHLIRQLATEKTRLMKAAMISRVRDSLSQGVAELSLRIQALKLPTEELASKSYVLGETLQSIEERQRITSDVLAGEQRNLRDRIETSVAALRSEASSKLARLLDETRVAQGTEALETAPNALSGVIQQIFDTARDDLAAEISGGAHAILATYQKRIDTDVDTVRRTAAKVFQTPFSGSREPAVFALGQEPYWVTQETRSNLLPDPGRWLDHFLPKSLRAKRLRARMIRQFDELVLRNAENLRWALLRGVDETFREATVSLQARLDEAVSATRGAIEEALVRRRDASHAIDSDLERLNHANEAFSMLRHQLSGKDSRPHVTGAAAAILDCQQP